jgi:hypothetical protein
MINKKALHCHSLERVEAGYSIRSTSGHAIPNKAPLNKMWHTSVLWPTSALIENVRNILLSHLAILEVAGDDHVWRVER